MRVCNEHHSVEMKTYTAALMSNFNQKQIQNNFISFSDGAPCHNSDGWKSSTIVTKKTHVFFISGGAFQYKQVWELSHIGVAFFFEYLISLP